MSRQTPCVLVVEDEGAQREVLQYNLEAEGFDVVVADNGEDALLLVQEEQPDLMVLDWMLPRVSGIEVCRQVKADPGTRSIPIIMLSARGEETDRVRGFISSVMKSVGLCLVGLPHPAADYSVKIQRGGPRKIHARTMAAAG